MKKGIDVSHHNPNFHFEAVKNKIDFVMIRAGFGKNNPDREFKRNVYECTRLKIPFGLYWFSYALDTEMVEKEADYICDKALGLNVEYPIVFDFEYGSISYMEKNGINPTKELIRDIAIAFLERVQQRGYYAMLYTNRDFMRKYYDGLEKKYAIWYAEWNVENPSIPCPMWQYGINKEFEVDGDYCYKDYPNIINNLNFITESQKARISRDISATRWNDYYHAAKTIMTNTMNADEILAKCKEMNLDFIILNIVIEIMKGN